MNEEQLEQIEKIFPNGFLIVVPDVHDKQHLRMALTKANDNPNLVILLALIEYWIKLA